MANSTSQQNLRPIQTPATGFPVFFYRRRLPRVITEDVWACLRHLMERSEGLSHEGRRQIMAYVEQAFDFYQAAENPQIASRPLLYYYAFLNLAKAFLVAKGISLPARVNHGIKEPAENNRQRVRFEGQKVFVQRPSPDRSQVFPELVRALRGTPVSPRSFRVLDLLAQVPAIHRTYTDVRRRAPSFLPIKKFEILSDGKYLRVRMLVSSTAEARRVLLTIRKQRQFRKTFARLRARTKGEIWFEGKRERGRGRGIDKGVSELANPVRNCGIWAILTEDGYSYYMATFPRRRYLPQLASIYAIMFYFGSVTRYRPYNFDRIVGGRYAWLVKEFIATQPYQFLYLMASTLAGVDVVRPFALSEKRKM